MRRPITGSPWAFACSAQDDCARVAPSLVRDLCRRLMISPPLAQVTQALPRVSCEDPARWPRRLGETQPLKVAHSPDPDLPQRIGPRQPDPAEDQ